MLYRHGLGLLFKDLLLEHLIVLASDFALEPAASEVGVHDLNSELNALLDEHLDLLRSRTDLGLVSGPLSQMTLVLGLELRLVRLVVRVRSEVLVRRGLL